MDNSKDKVIWIEWLKALFIALLLAFILKSFIFATSIVKGDSMVPTLQTGERIIFNKFIYIISKPNRGDIVIITHPNENYVKRIIGLPGETIEVRDYKLFINEVEQDSSFVNAEEHNLLKAYEFGPIIIPANHYFVIGDNRSISRDSRNGLGLIDKKDIIGRSEFIIYPFNEWEITR